MLYQPTVMSRNGGLFQAEMILPAQYYPLLRGEACPRSGECRLVAAVLDDAIQCYRKYRRANDVRKQRLFREAERWIMKAGGDDLPFSFEYICAVLGIEPEYIRRGLRQWQGTDGAATGRPGTLPLS